MRVVAITSFGGAEVLALEERVDAVAEAGQALIAVEAVGVGYADVMAREGRYVKFPDPGIVPGLEVAGRVVAVGEGGDSAWIGRRVFAMPMDGGGYSELIARPIDELMPIPDGLSCVDAVGLGMNAFVAKVGIERATLAHGERVFVRGAGGGIGLMAVQIAAARGAVVTATTSSDERGARLRALGAKHLVDRSRQENEVGDGFDVIVDTIAGPDLGKYVRRLNANGRYVMCGGIAGAPNADFGMDLLSVFHHSPAFFAFSLNSIAPRELAAVGAKLFEDALEGRIKSVIDRELPLSDAAEAHRAQESGNVFGKIVLIP